MKLELINSNEAPKAIGPYSHAVKAGNLIITSGQLGINPETGKLISDNIEDQIRQVLTNLKAVLSTSGADFNQVVDTQIFLTDLNDFTLVNQIYTEFMQDHKPPRTTIQVAGLPLKAKIEIKMIALI